MSCPTGDSINSALEKLEDEGLLRNNKWQDLKDEEIPSKTNEIETKVFERLVPNVKALTEQECFGTDSTAPRKCNYDCGNKQMIGEIAGSTFLL